MLFKIVEAHKYNMVLDWHSQGIKADSRNKFRVGKREDKGSSLSYFQDWQLKQSVQN